MRFIDLLRMSVSNLFKRKVRTVLTVLGVVIGVASIVVMVSLGLGLNKATMEQISDYASLTAITVSEPWNQEGGEQDKKRLDDEFINDIMQMPYVVGVDPYLSVDILARYGTYEGYIRLQGTTLSALDDMNIDVGEGTLPQEDAGELQLFFGNMVLADFYSVTGGGGGYWETNELPDIDLMNDSILYILDRDAYYNSQGGGTDENGKPYKKPKKHLLTTAGVAAGGMDEYHPYSWNTYCDINELIPVLKKEFKGRAIPGQPTTSKGKPYKEIFYSQLIVNVDEMEHVAEVTQMITDLGYDIVSVEDGRVTFYGDEEACVRANICLRTAERILIRIGRFPAGTFEELFQGTKALPWEDYIPSDGRFWVAKAASVKSALFSPSDIQSVMKKAMVERLRETYHVNRFAESGASFPMRVFLMKD